MKKLFACLALITALPAAASTFTPATDGTFVCTSYCAGYVTDDPTVSVGFANVTVASSTDFALTLQVNGVYFHARGTAGQLGRGVAATGDDGTTRTVSAYWSSRTTCVRSGRGQHCTTWRSVLGGSI